MGSTLQERLSALRRSFSFRSPGFTVEQKKKNYELQRDCANQGSSLRKTALNFEVVYLKCGFCKKSFIMNDFLRNLHFSPYILCSPGFTVEQKRLCKLGEQFTQNSLICRGDNPAKLKFLYFEKATKFCETFTLLLIGTKLR